MEVQLKAWGNSQGVRLPKSILNEAGIQPNDTLLVKAEEGRIILYRSFRHKTLEERSAEYNGKLDWRGEPAGNEVW